MRTLALILLAAPLWAQQADPIAAMTADDLARGKRLYGGQCAACHGQTAEGGRGPNLAVPKLRRAADNQALFDVIQNGVQGTEMEGTWQMTDREIWQVAAFIRSLSRVNAEPLAGDAARGRLLYASSGCASCHIVRGEGRGLGPDLSEVGARRSAAFLRQALANPGKSAPEGFLMVRVATRDGQEVKGIRINEDSFTLQIRDLNGQMHSFRKRAVKDVSRLAGESPMPSYAGQFSAAQLDDLVAYLAGLRGPQ